MYFAHHCTRRHGTRHNTARTHCYPYYLVGASLRSGRDTNSTPATNFNSNYSGGAKTDSLGLEGIATDIVVKYQSEDSRCVPYAFLNLLSLHSKKKDKLMKFHLTLCPLSALCMPVGRLFSKTLEVIDQVLSWLLLQKTGLFLVVDGLHCVGVDCARGLIFDCGYPTAFKLCLEAFAHCGIVKADEMRQIV